MELSGHCLCGAIHYKANVENPVAAVCHCTHCQRQSGSVLSLVVVAPAAALQWTGVPARYDDSADSGATVVRHFCQRCGSPLVSISTATPDIAYVKAGTLDQLADLTPVMEVWRQSAVSWLKIDPPVPGQDRQG